MLMQSVFEVHNFCKIHKLALITSQYTMIKYTLLAFSALLSAFSNAQESDFCTTHSLSDAVLAADPVAKTEYDQLEQGFEAYALQKQNMRASSSAVAGPDKVIPVVFHIIHDYTSNYISDEQVESAMEYINYDFQKQNPDTIETIPAFAGIAADLDITFRLAQLDPDGNCTKGVTRTYSTLTHTAGENVKDLVKWDPSKYLNVWIVDQIASGAGGYSYLPGSAPGNDANAGILVINSQFGAVGTSNGSGFSAHTLSHEIGHYLGLAHTWGGSNTPGLASNCSLDDGISDTPECVGQSFNCDLDIQTCGSLDNVQNFMCYAGCPTMFTEGQGDRVHYFLDNHFTGNAPRYELWQHSNLVATGTNDGYVPQECTPIADIHTEYTSTCVGEEIVINGYAYNVDNVNFSWDVTGATSPNQTGDQAYAVYNTPGIYPVTLEATNSAGTATVVKTDYIIVRNNADQSTLPFYQDFEQSLTLNNPADGDSWFESTDFTDTWEVATVGYNSSKSYKARTRYFSELGQAILETSFIDFTNAQSGTRLYFRYAYKQRASFVEDRLMVYISDDCGVTWKKRKTINSDDLITSEGVQNATWEPQSDEDWVETYVNMASVVGDPGVLIRFVLEGENGNFVYIDGIEIHNFTVGLEDEIQLAETALDVYPNPLTDESVIEINAEAGNAYSLTITNVLGQVMYAQKDNINNDKHIVPMPTNLTTGMYFIDLNIDGKHATKKVLVQ